MSNRSNIAAENVLELLNSKFGIQLIKAIEDLSEALENKHDPEQTEMYLYENINHFQERLGNVRFNLTSYVRESNPLLGDKLSSLYNDTDKIRIDKI